MPIYRIMWTVRSKKRISIGQPDFFFFFHRTSDIGHRTSDIGHVMLSARLKDIVGQVVEVPKIKFQIPKLNHVMLSEVEVPDFIPPEFPIPKQVVPWER